MVKLLKENIEKKFLYSGLVLAMMFFLIDTKITSNKSLHKQVGLHPTK